MTMPDRTTELTTLFGEILQYERAIQDTPVTAVALTPMVIDRKRKLIRLISSDPGAIDLATFSSNGLLVDSPTGDSVNIGTTQYIFQTIYGREPTPDEHARLEWYLNRIASIPANEKRSHQFFLRLATTEAKPFLVGNVSDDWLEYVDTTFLPVGRLNPDIGLPHEAVIGTPVMKTYSPSAETNQVKVEDPFTKKRYEADAKPDDPAVVLSRSILVTEALTKSLDEGQGIVLLGEPGSGKSQFLRCLLKSLARKKRQEQSSDIEIQGWAEHRPMIPVFIPLRQIAMQMRNSQNDHRNATTDALIIESILVIMQESGAKSMEDLVHDALDKGGMLLMFDGLDEIPFGDESNQIADRLTVTKALAQFARSYRANIVIVTSRNHAFTAEVKAALNWHIVTIAPFTLGQVKELLATLLEERGLTPEFQSQISKKLLAAITQRQELFAFARSPWLLKVMVDIVTAGKDIPFERPKLFDNVIDHMLDGWKFNRPQTTLASDYHISKDELDKIRPILESQVFQAFVAASGNRTATRIVKAELFSALYDMFKQDMRSGQINPAEACLEYMEQRGDLVALEADKCYRFVQPMLQEYCIARYMVQEEERVINTITQYRHQNNWRDVIMLSIGMVKPIALNQILENLVEREENGESKPLDTWYNDLCLAYDVIQDRSWETLRQLKLIRLPGINRDLQEGCTAMVADTKTITTTSQRRKAGAVLADVGDNRYPVTITSWQESLRKKSILFADSPDILSNSYFCYVPYQLEVATATDLSAKPQAFWMARYPLTIHQYRAFAESGYNPSSPSYWSAEGIAWAGAYDVSTKWANLQTKRHNHAMVNISFYEASAYGAWLTAQCADALPEGYVLRLPTCDEWLRGALYDSSDVMRRYPWGEAAPTLEKALYASRESAPIGCYPTGIAACGAYDCAGNVWEWTCSSNEQAGQGAAYWIAGGSWASPEQDLECAKFNASKPDNISVNVGVRLVLAPILL